MTKPGTYAAVKFSDEVVAQIEHFCDEWEIPNPVPPSRLHATLISSREHLPEYEAYGEYLFPIFGRPTEFAVWETGPSDPEEEKNRCLVLLFKCPEFVERHESLLDDHEATHAYADFKPHITFSYDIGDFDVEDLPLYTGPIEIVEEYQEELDLNWAKNKGIS